MHSPALYGAWETPSPIPTRCSYLYLLPPIGIGTPTVESFTGYITRLAAAHAVEAGVLVNSELLPRVPCTKGASIGNVPSTMPTSFFIDAFPLNGIGERARAWVSVLERMTGIRGLNLLTLLPWSKVMSCVHLLRTHRAWCPYCYGEPRALADQEIYDRLLWNFQVVTACPVHHSPLESICPSCTKRQYVFAPKMRPGCCSRCQAWLGRAPKFSAGDRSEPVHIAEMVGELLAASPRLANGFGLDQFRENMRTFRRCRQLHAIVERRNTRGWTRRNAPRMDSLVILMLHQNTSMLDLLTERVAAIEVSTGRSNPHTHYRVDGLTIEQALQTALRDDVPPSVAEIATRLGYRTVAPLQFRFHDLCHSITGKRRANLKLSSIPATVPIPRERIEQALSDALIKGGPVSLTSLAASVGVNKRRLYKGFHNLRKALVANNTEHRRQRTAAIENALRAALAEAPAPSLTDIARRLGLKSTSALTRRFPDLSAHLKQLREATPDNGLHSSLTLPSADLPLVAAISGH